MAEVRNVNISERTVRFIQFLAYDKRNKYEGKIFILVYAIWIKYILQPHVNQFYHILLISFNLNKNGNQKSFTYRQEYVKVLISIGHRC